MELDVRSVPYVNLLTVRPILSFWTLSLSCIPEQLVTRMDTTSSEERRQVGIPYKNKDTKELALAIALKRITHHVYSTAGNMKTCYSNIYVEQVQGDAVIHKLDCRSCPSANFLVFVSKCICLSTNFLQLQKMTLHYIIRRNTITSNMFEFCVLPLNIIWQLKGGLRSRSKLRSIPNCASRSYHCQLYPSTFQLSTLEQQAPKWRSDGLRWTFLRSYLGGRRLALHYEWN